VTILAPFAGGLAAVALAAALGWAAWLAARRLVPGPALAARWSALVLIALWLSTAGFWLLSPWRLFQLGPALTLAAVAAAAAHLALAGRRGGRAALAALAGDLGRAIRALATLLRRPAGWLLAALAAVAGLRLARAAAAPPLGWDALTYHLLKAGRFVQDGGAVPEAAPDAWRIYEHLAPGGELLWGWAMLPLHTDTLVPPIEAAVWAAVPLAVYALARQLGAVRDRAVLAAATVGALPASVAMIGSAYVDNLAAAALLLGALFAVRAWTMPEGPASAAAIAAAGLGLSIGVKLSVAASAGLLAAVLAVAVWRRRPGRGRLLAACVAAAAVGAPSYLANWAVTGSPLYPFGLRIAGRDLLPWLGIDVMTGGRPVSTVEAAALALWRPTSEGAFIGQGLAALPVVLLAAAALPRLLRDRRRRGGALILAGTAAVTAAVALTPALETVRTTLDAAVAGRYFLVVPAALAALGAAACGRWAGTAWCAALTLALWQAWPRGWVAGESEPVVAAVLLGLALAAALAALGLAAARRREGRAAKAVAALAAALAIAAATAALDAQRARWRYPLWAAAARPRAPLFHLHRLHPVYASAWSLWRDFDRPEPLRLAATAGWDRRGHNWYRYPLLGRRLQNRVLFVPVTTGGEPIDHRDAERRAAAASFRHWLARLVEQRVDVVVSLAPRWTIEDAWARSAPELFRACGTSRGNLHAAFCLDRDRAAAWLAAGSPPAASEPSCTLWDSVDREADELPLTDEHKRILDQRLDAAECHPEGWLDWDEAKERVLASLRRRPGA